MQVFFEASCGQAAADIIGELVDIVVECALALVLDDAALPPLAHLGGILTPATALGEVLVKRLENTGRIWFESEVVHTEGVERRKE